VAVYRERKMIRAHTGSDVDIKWGTLKDALEKIQDLIAEYGEDAEIDTYQERYSDTEYLGVYVHRPETDEEMKRRIAEEEKWDAQQARRDREEFERLKAKFGG
jgi:hypothetical protein